MSDEATGKPNRAGRLVAALRTPSARTALRRTIWTYGAVRARLASGGAAATIAWACRPRTGQELDPDAAWWWTERLIGAGRLPGSCLVRSLVMARLLAAGDRPAIRFGVRGTDEGVHAHAWVELRGRTFGADVDFLPLGRAPNANRRTQDGS